MPCIDQDVSQRRTTSGQVIDLINKVIVKGRETTFIYSVHNIRLNMNYIYLRSGPSFAIDILSA